MTVLSIVSAPRESWHRLPKESPEEYAAFVAWCVAPGERPVPPDRKVASLHSWAERARVWDTRFAYKPKEAIAETIENLKQTIVNESRKFIRDSTLQDARVLTVTELAKLLLVIQGVAELPLDDDFSFDSASPEDIDALLKVYEKCASVRAK